MTLPVPVGVIGAGRLTSALADYEAPLRGARIAQCAPSPCGADLSRAATLAERTGAGFTRDWNVLAADPSLPAVLVASDEPGRITPVEAALLAGKVVCCPVPAVTQSTELERLSAALSRGGALISAGMLRHTPAGKRALRISADGELGALHSVYAAVRLPSGQPAQRGQDILDGAGWEIFDFLLSLTPASVRRVHAHTATLFGLPPVDTAVLTIRFADDLIATVELSRCLPPAVPVPPSGDIEIEVIGARQAIRILPGAPAVQVYGTRTTFRPWVDDPVISMVEELAAVASGETPKPWHLDPLRRVIALMDAVRTEVQ